jgi:hypothetical protein
VDAILLDFSKAFDKVPHERLLLKLHHYGIRGLTLQCIKNFLLDRTQQVLLEGTQSKTCPVDSGVRFFVMWRVKHLFALKDICQVFSHISKLLRSS